MGEQLGLKHEILKGVEYASITRQGKEILEIEGKDLENVKWRDFQKIIGARVGAGRCGFSIKFKNKSKMYAGTTKGVEAIMKSNPSEKDILEVVTKKFTELEKRIDVTAKAGGVPVEMLLESNKLNFQARIDFLNERLAEKNITIAELKAEIKDLEKELDTLEDKIRELESQTGLSQYIDIGKKILEAKMGAGKPVSLEASDTSDIPPQILEILGAVDYSRISPEDLDQIVLGLQKYISFLPMKGKKL